jgi:carbonic anhydrase/acetyltransferase-like protein (isoleucine patch superfamily)
MEKKYKFTEETRIYNGRLLHRIVAIRDFLSIIAGTKGGWIEKEDNLSHEGDCWVRDEAIVCDKACVFDNAKVAGNAIVEKCGHVFGEASVSVNARITDYAAIFGYARVFGAALVGERANVCGNSMIGMNAVIEGHAIVEGGCIYGKTVIEGNSRVTGKVVIDGTAYICGNAVIAKNEDFIVFKNWWSSGRYFTWTRSNDKYKVGCFYGTGKELIEAAYNHDEKRGREYERIVNYVNSIKNDGK